MSTKESDIVAALIFLPCPSCNGILSYIKEDGPVNTTCTKCKFKARYLIVESDPQETIFVAEQELLIQHVEKGELLPPLLINFRWIDDKIKHEQVNFFPFFPVKYFRNALSPVALMGEEIPHVALFRLHEVDSTILTSSPTDEEIALMISTEKNLSTSWIQRKFGIGYAHAANIMDLAKEIKRKRGEVVDEDTDSE